MEPAGGRTFGTCNVRIAKATGVCLSVCSYRCCAMKNLLPNATDEFRRLNPHLFDKRDSTGNVERKRVIRKGMNKTEASFAERLEYQKQLGEIRDYLFHPFRLPWADMHYTPDFMVTPNSGLEKRRMIEVKGPHIHYRQQAIARFKGARSYWPEFQFECWQKKKTGWEQIL